MNSYFYFKTQKKVRLVMFSSITFEAVAPTSSVLLLKQVIRSQARIHPCISKGIDVVRRAL